MYLSCNKKLGLLVWLCLVTITVVAQQAPHGIYLTWIEDPTTTIHVDWHTDDEEESLLHVREKGKDKWRTFDSKVLPYPFSERWIHRVGVKSLKENTAYELRFGDATEIYYFHTLPKNLKKKSLKIAIGGDTMHQKEWFEKTNRVVASYEPDFVIIGGDMAYENGLAENIQRIYDWFDGYKNTLILEDGRILPCIVAIGNHEVVGGYHDNNQGYEQTDSFRARIAPYFYGMFAFPGQPGYNTLDIGDYLSFFILDTQHSNPIVGKQTEWLENALSERKKVMHKIPVYHVPGYPSVREYEGKAQTLVRENWMPLFDAHDVQIAFSNHDHAYKRTFPIKSGEVNEAGVVYVGDGSWGVEPRPIHDKDSTWYLKEVKSVRAFTLLTLDGKDLSFISVDEDGNVIDEYSITQKGNRKKEKENDEL